MPAACAMRCRQSLPDSPAAGTVGSRGAAGREPEAGPAQRRVEWLDYWWQDDR
jgi:hypothetical protein